MIENLWTFSQSRESKIKQERRGCEESQEPIKSAVLEKIILLEAPRLHESS